MNKFRLDFKISITQKCHHCIHNLHFTLKYNLSTYSNIVAWDWTGQATLLQFCDKLWLVLLWSRFIHTLILHTHKSILYIQPSKTIVKVNDKADLINIWQMFNLRRFGCQTIHPTQKFTSMNLLQKPCVIT